jgi:Ca-activated chloride channel family protein
MTGPPGVEIMNNGSEKAVTARTAAVIAVLLMIVALASWGIPLLSGSGVEAGELIPPVAPQQMGHPAAVLARNGVDFTLSLRDKGGASAYTTKADAKNVASDGSLQVVDKDGNAGMFCPLKHTDVKAEISGFLARVTVTQEFTNPSQDNVEAIYVFPLPHDSAVDDMALHVGDRVVRSLIKKRDEAQKIYNEAKNAGHVAALLNQERPNIFTQAVANIAPGANVKVEISYVETLKYEAGSYEFVFPMVVGPRYIPGAATGQQAGGWSPDTNQVPDASRITPPVAGVHYGVKGTRAGHDISLAVKLDAGVAIKELRSLSHDVTVNNANAHSALVRLKSENEIPNRDFILKYDVAGGKIEDALLVHANASSGHNSKGGDGEPSVGSAGGGYFSFILQPPDRVRDEDATPRELIFVLDTSGSMSGFPIETAKKTMRRAIEHLRPGDTFNLITFAGDTQILFPSPVMATAANVNQAIQFMEGRRGGGGTEMMKAIRAALGEQQCGPTENCAVNERAVRSDDRTPLRVVCFMTDGYVGNDMQIVAEVQKHPEARVFSFGIGTAVNRFLLENMARAGRGEVEFVTNESEAAPAADRFYERVHTPVLTDISIDWNGLPVSDVMPARLLDLFSAKPLVITGRYSGGAKGTIKLRGKRAGQRFEREIRVDLPANEPANQALEQLWARTRIEKLMSQDWNGMQQGNPKAELRDEITQLGLDYRLVTQFTSFVAVEERTVVDGGRTRTIQVPVEIPQGVSPEGVFGDRSSGKVFGGIVQAQAMASPVMTSNYKSMQSVDAASAGRFTGVLPMAKANESVDIKAANAPAPRKDERRELESKLHPGLLAVYECWVRSPAKCASVNQGRIGIQVWLSESSPSVMKELKALGFVVTSGKSGAQVRGTLPIEKLQSLAEMKQVKLVALEGSSQ